MTKQEILDKIKERRQERERAAKLEAAKKRIKRPVYSKNLNEGTKDRRVVKETLLGDKNKRQPRTITEDIKQRTAQFETKEQKYLYTTLAENMTNAVKMLHEATQAGPAVSGVTGQGAGVGLMKTYFDIFFGYFPNLIVTEIASTQPIKTEKAMIFYYNTIAGSDKGNVSEGDELITPFEINTDVNYTSYLTNLPNIADAQLTYDTDHNEYDSGSKVLWAPLIAKSVQIENAELTWSTNTAFTGVYTESDGTEIAITNGVVTADATSIQVTFDIAKDEDGWDPGLKITYSYDNKYAPTEVPELNADVDSRDIVAKARTIKTNFSFQAGVGFEAQFGVKLEDKLAESAMFELKRETDLDFVFEIMNSAPVQVIWNRGGGVANGLYQFHKQSFRDAIVGASNYIYKVSKRVRGNVLLVGVNAQTIVETLDDFQGSNYGSQLGGPTVIGKLKDIKVIAIPSLGENDWAVIYKNDKDNLDAGIVFAPYIPVVATQPVTLDDFVIRRAYTMSYGKLVTNANYFVRGRIINDTMAQPVLLVTKDGTTSDMGVLGTDASEATAPAFPS
jgi:hypothetical protein